MRHFWHFSDGRESVFKINPTGIEKDPNQGFIRVGQYVIITELVAGQPVFNPSGIENLNRTDSSLPEMKIFLNFLSGVLKIVVYLQSESETSFIMKGRSDGGSPYPLSSLSPADLNSSQTIKTMIEYKKFLKKYPDEEQVGGVLFEKDFPIGTKFTWYDRQKYTIVAYIVDNQFKNKEFNHMVVFRTWSKCGRRWCYQVANTFLFYNVWEMMQSELKAEKKTKQK